MDFHKILFIESKFIILGLLLKYVLMDYFLPRQDVSWNLSKMLLILEPFAYLIRQLCDIQDIQVAGIEHVAIVCGWYLGLLKDY